MRLINLYEQEQKCKMCNNSATKKVLWADGRAFIPVCDDHVDDAKAIVVKRNQDKVLRVVPIK